jgi:hypothetical protein
MEHDMIAVLIHKPFPLDMQRGQGLGHLVKGEGKTTHARQGEYQEVSFHIQHLFLFG